MTRIKICGITNLEDAISAVDLGGDPLGFIFTKSPRQISPGKAKNIIKKLPPFINVVGVFVNFPMKTVEKIAETCKIDTLQFHGNETPDYCAKFRETHKVIKAFRIKDKESLKLLNKYDVDGYLLDTYIKGTAGGTGKVFDWDLAKEAKRFAEPIILSGGINPGNVKDAIRKVKPYAVDVSSGVERSPGKKDIRLMKEFINAVRVI